MLSGSNLPPIEDLMDGDLQEWQGGASYHIGAPPLYTGSLSPDPKILARALYIHSVKIKNIQQHKYVRRVLAPATTLGATTLYWIMT